VAKGRIRSTLKKKVRNKVSTGRTGAGARRLKKAATSVARRIGTVKEAFHAMDAQMKLHRFKIRHFEPKVRISVQKGHFTVKTVETGPELEEVLKLRFDVFNREYMQKKRSVGVDVDKLDYICDHLVIRDNRAGRIVGTYRMNSSTFSDRFYSSGEFHFQKIENMAGNILELGRAAIDKEYRTGVVIALLWRGISQYMLKTETDILLGCASVKTMEPLEIGLVTHYLEKKGIIRYDLDVEPTRKYKVKTLPKVRDYLEKNPFEYDEEKVEQMIPALFASYIKMGFKAYGEPAIDRDFNCIDFLIMIRLDELEGPYKRRYNDKNRVEESTGAGDEG
jgi:putative hemolysin